MGAPRARTAGGRLAVACAVAAVALAAAGCGGVSWLRVPWFGGGDEERPAPPPVSSPIPAPAPVPVLSDQAALGFHDRAQAFYERLMLRRFNTLATYEDDFLRSYFQTPDAYSDYYAKLAQDLSEARFEKNRPLQAEVQEFSLESDGRARVRYRLVGDNSRPLRFWETSLERVDIWEQSNGRWWIVPGKL